ncbi:HEPN domain-containing protein [Candidatus Pyrohabitans sp.]
MRKAKKKLKVAKDNLEMGHFEEAVSMIYYSAYHAMRALLFLKNIKPKTHKGVLAEFGKNFIKSGEFDEEFSVFLSKSFERRQKSDYDVIFEIGEDEAVDLFEKGVEFLKRAEEYITIDGRFKRE